MKLKLIILVLFSTLVMASERFSNTNGVINDKSLKDLLKWSDNIEKVAKIEFDKFNKINETFEPQHLSLKRKSRNQNYDTNSLNSINTLTENSIFY